MAYPKRLLTDDEEIIREFNPHWRVLAMSALWAVVGLAAIIVGMASFDGAGAWALGIAGAVAILVFALPPVVAWKFRLYVLTTERIIVRDGIVSRGGIEIPLENINNVLFQQNVVERLLGYGDVLIESAGSQGQSRLTDIPDPEAFQSEVYRVRENRTTELRGTSPAAAPRDATEKLATLADLHERGALSDEEFAAKKARLLDEI